jgi:hypothetical protein
MGERPEIHAFLGSYLLGEAADRAAPTLSSTATPTGAPKRARRTAAYRSAT